MSLGTKWVLDWARGCAQMAADHRMELIELDLAIGDGDHGENLDRGFSAVAAGLDDLSEASPGEVLKYIAMTLMSTVGGAAGPLYGTAFLRAAKVTGDEALDSKAVVNLMAAALGGIQDRGKAEPGEKTMVDAWRIALDSAQQAETAGADARQVLEAAARGAAAGAESTIPMVATKGRASYLGKRSVGHLDPGARSSALILSEAAKAAAK